MCPKVSAFSEVSLRFTLLTLIPGGFILTPYLNMLCKLFQYKLNGIDDLSVTVDRYLKFLRSIKCILFMAEFGPFILFGKNLEKAENKQQALIRNSCAFRSQMVQEIGE